MFFHFLKRISKTLFSPKYLLVTNTVFGVTTVSAGDSVQQFIEYSLEDKRNDFEFNKRRNLNMMFAGIYFGLFGHFWYSLLDRRFPGSATRTVAKKLVAEAAMGPPLVSGLYLIISRLRGMSFETSWVDLKSSLPLICIVEWTVYIPLQYINFRLFPPKFRYLYVAIISVGYDAFLSYVIHRVFTLLSTFSVFNYVFH